MTLGQLTNILNGQLIRGKHTTKVSHALYLSTQHLNAGSVFFYSPSKVVPSTDNARNFASLKRKQSAGIIVPASWAKRVPSHHSVIVVPDVKVAIYRLAKWHRKQSKAIFIGVTGSAGKTTTKELLTAILCQKYCTLKSVDNLNVFQYIPYSLFHLQRKHEAVVLEMGMASLGNIKSQCLTATPHIGIVTNVGEAHVGSLGSSLQNVVRAKQELVDGVLPHGLLVINADDQGSKKLSFKRHRGKLITIGIKNKANLRATHVHYHPQGMRFKVDGHSYSIPMYGEHNVYNALAAIAVAKHLKMGPVAIQKGIHRFYRPPYMRMQQITGIRGSLLINDAYNANPSSVIAGLNTVSKIAQNRYTIAVLGEMSELGSLSIKGHRQVGRAVAEYKPNQLLTIGTHAKQIANSAILNGFPESAVHSFDMKWHALRYLEKEIPQGAIVYFKASRNLFMEDIVNRLRASREIKANR
ncbi:UDP-N-acetylmuramoyl-tripeptide--D-alanyl-D-alanine ligase [Mechercharimyces sp. CAU 1602]|uniref:UDP-N-acetylmuramoyl-tripeptide--D-alanyl-D- alanine ligase n=1 Tax=Mechercharimyces sp. CAU 1602 TaxID=2973933 RepID=UPI00216349B3|nr:UDP-N-acetylmuramoyl-tripeptide--D-alanyl-D-alanine ligase [Mechercharimyces sp. CAU 1602]MCS1351119.1 UDP-N-acetylmuramoyl-tripeptide--D-alanyl-D-alanine ligase [Mechercharimyces sp. CAU 1602]